MSRNTWQQWMARNQQPPSRHAGGRQRAPRPTDRRFVNNKMRSAYVKATQLKEKGGDEE